MTTSSNALVIHEGWHFTESFVPHIWQYVIWEKDTRTMKRSLLAVIVCAPSKYVYVLCCINLDSEFLYFIWSAMTIEHSSFFKKQCKLPRVTFLHVIFTCSKWTKETLEKGVEYVKK